MTLIIVISVDRNLGNELKLFETSEGAKQQEQTLLQGASKRKRAFVDSKPKYV